MPPIRTKNNPYYGGPSGQNKYSPLSLLQLAVADTAVCDGLVNGRINRLIDTNIFPADLELLTADWNAVAASEVAPKAKLPPLVVVSSNRSAYIARGVAEAARALPHGAAAYNNIADVRSLRLNDAEAIISPPLYVPLRLGNAPERNVYVVVHQLEYATYTAALAGSGITVVGWSFAAHVGGNQGALTGFGATRYAAVAFCKYLRATAAGHADNPRPGEAPWGKAWIFDDNVIALNARPAANGPGGAGFMSLLADAEARMSAGSAAVVGFHGQPIPQTREANRNWANALCPGDQDGTIVHGLPGPRTVGLVQQAALWNIEYLADRLLNFSAIFLASKEDVSVCSYFDQKPILYRFYDQVDVIKEMVPPALHDSAGAHGAGAQAVLAARRAWETNFRIQEGLTEVVSDNQVRTLVDFIQNVVIPATQPLLPSDDATVTRAVCCAVEQIATRAIWAPAPPPPPGQKAPILSPAELASMFTQGDDQTITALAP